MLSSLLRFQSDFLNLIVCRVLPAWVRSLLFLTAVASPGFAQVTLISGYNFGQFIGVGFPSLSGVTGDPAGSIGSNYRLNTQPPNNSSGDFVGNNSLEGNYSNGFGRIFWDGTNGSSSYNFSNGVQIVASEFGGANGVNSYTVQGYQMGLQGDGLNLSLTTAVANNKLAFVQNTTGYMDYAPAAYSKSDLLTSNANFTFAAQVSSPVTVSWFLGTSNTAFATTNLTGSEFTSYSVDLPPEFYGLLSSVLVAQFSGTASIDNVQFNGVALGSTPPASSQFWKGGTGSWTASTTPTEWRDSAGTAQSAWSSGTAVFREVTGQTPGTVTIDSAGVTVTGLQFTTTGYTVAGDNINTTTASTPIQVDTGATATVSAKITGTGGINKTSAGALTLSGANDYAGTTTVTAGTLAVNGVQTGTGAVTVASGATLTGSGTLGGAVTVAAGGILSQVSASKLTVPSLTLANTSIMNLTLGAPATTELFKVGGALTLGGTLNVSAGTGFGAGLYGLFDFTGALTGTLTPGTIPSGFTAAIQTSVANKVNVIFGAETATNLPLWAGGAGTWTASTTAPLTAWKSASGTTTGGWTTGGAIFFGTAGTVTVDNTAGPITFTGLQLASTGYTVAGGTLTTTTAATALRVGDGTAAGAAINGTISAIIAGTGGVEKTDLGALTLSGANTYAGPTAVTAGMLTVNGNQGTATGAVSVASGATLGGTGTLGGAVTVAGGGILRGAAGSTLTFPSLSLANTSILNVTLGAPSPTELFKVNGNLTLAGVLNVTGNTDFGAGLYRLMSYGGTLTNNTLTPGTVPTGFTAAIQVPTDVKQVNAVFSAGATPPPAGQLPMWGGGASTWTAATTSTAWKSVDGATAGAWTPGLAILAGTAGTVTVDNAAGAVAFTGLQLANTGYTVAGGTLTTTTAATALRVGDGTAAGAAMAGTISSIITGTGGVEKTDLGTLTLSGANTYTGTTAVTAGTLLATGNQSTATGAVSVAPGATLGGTGTLGGAVTVAGGGILRGTAGSTLTLPSLSLANTSILNVVLGAPSTSELFKVNGNLTLDGVLNVTGNTGFGAGLYRLFNYTGILTDNILTAGTVPTGFTGSIQTVDASKQINAVFLAESLSAPAGALLPMWKGGDGVWTAATTPTNWKSAEGSATGAWAPTLAIFSGTAGTVTVDNAAGPVNFTGLQFANTGYTVSGGALTTTAPATALRVGDGTVAGVAINGTISSVISGGGGLEKTDLGRAILTGANTYTGGTTITAGILQLGNGGTTGSITGNVTNNSALSFNRSDTVTFAGTIRGLGSVTQTGNGTTILTGANNYSGTTIIGAGTLQLGDNGTTGSVTGDVNNNGTLAIKRSDATTLAGIISGTGALNQAGAGTTTLTGANTYTGGTTITSGTLQLGAGGTTGTIAGNITNNATLAVNRSDALAFGGVMSGTGALQQNGRGTTTLTGVNSYTGTTTVAAGTLLIDGNQSAATGAITVAAGGSLGGNGTTGGNITVAASGALTGATGRTLTTTGSLTLDNTSRLNVALGAPTSKSLFVAGGALTLDGIVNVANAGGLAVGTYRLADYGGTLTNNTVTIGNAAINPADLSIVLAPSNPVNLVVAATVSDYWKGGDGTWTALNTDTSWKNLNGAAPGTWLGRTATFGGTAGTVTVSNAAGAVNLTGAQFLTTGYTVAGGTLTTAAGGATLQVGNASTAGAANTATISSVIAGTGAVTKTDLGTLTLSGTNTYTGATSVAEGALRVTGNSVGATGAVTVASGATLSGTGTLGGTVTVANGGILSQTAGGTLTMAGLNLANTSLLNVTLGAPSTSGLFQVNGNLTLDGTLNVTGAPSFGAGSYRIIGYTGTLLANNGLEVGTLPSTAYQGTIQTSVANQVNLIVGITPGSLVNWTSGPGTWSTGGNGFGSADGVITNGGWTPGMAIFGGAPGTVVVDTAAPVVVTGVQLASNGYTIAGGALTTNTADTALRVGDGTVAGAGFTGTVSSNIIGLGGINKTDLGTLVISGTNTYSGATTVSAGSLVVTGSSTSTAGTTISGGTLQLGNGGTTGSIAGDITNNAALRINRSNANSLDGVITGTGTVTKEGTGTTTLTGNNTYLGATTVSAGTLVLTGANTGTGATTVASAGILQVGAGGDTGSIAGAIANNGALRLNRTGELALPGAITGTGTVTQLGAGATTLAGNNTYTGATNVTAGTLTVAGTNTGTGAITVAPTSTFQIGTGETGSVVAAITNNGTVAINRSNAATLASAISGTGNLIKQGAGATTLTGANTYAGSTTISAGTLILGGANTGGGGVSVANAATLQVGAGATAGSLAGTITNNGTVAFNRSDALTYDGVISGSGAVTKQGAGTTTFSGNNTYSGATTVSGGTLVVSGTHTSAAGTTVAASSTLQLGAGGTTGAITGNVANNGTVTFNRSDAAGFGGVISGTGAVTQLGAGTTTLTGANTYSGATSVTNGTLVLAGANTGTGATTIASAGTLQLGAGGTSGSTTGAITNNGTLAVNRSDSVTLGGVISGTGTLRQQGSGTTILTGANTYTGATAVNSGTLVLTGANTGTGATTIAAAATLQIGAGGTTGSTVGAISNNGTLAVNRSDAVTLANVVSGAGAFIQAGTGTTTLTGANLHTGGTTISAGTLALGTGGSLAGSIVNNATFAINRTDAVTLGGTISGTGSVTKLGNGTATLSGANTFTGGTTITAGTLQIGTGGTTGSITGNVANSGALAFNRSDAASFDGVISGTGAVTQLGAGTTTLTGANTYAGATTVTNGTLILTGANTGTGATTIASTGTLQLGAGGTSGSTTGLITNNGTLAVNRSDAVTLGGIIFGTGTLRQQGSGTTILTGASTYTGATTVNSGTLQIGNAGTTGSIAGTGTVTVADGARLAINRSDAITLANVVSGAGALVQSGTGTTTLTGANLHTGGTTISAGTLALGTGGSLTGDILNNATLAINRTDSTTMGGTVSGTGALNKLGTGTATLTGTNTFTGGTTITAGAIEIVHDTNLGAPTSGVTLNGGTLRTAAGVTSARAITVGAGNSTIDTGANIFTASGVVSGTGTLEKIGAGELRLAGANTLTGLTTITAGSIRLDGGSLAAATIAANGTLGGTGTVRGNLINSGKLNPGASPGTVTVSGNFTQTATGTFNAELASATSFDSVIVAGNVTLAGTLAVTGLNGYVPDAGETFKIIDTTGTTGTAGAITGTFTTVTSPWDKLSPMLKFEALYGTNNVKLSMTQLPFADLKNTTVASTPNQKAVGGGIDGAIKLGSIKELQKALNALPTTDKVQAAIKEISPQRYERWFEQAVYSTGANIRVVENRMDQLQREPKAGLWSEVLHRDSRFDATVEKTKAHAGSDGIMIGGDARVLPDLQVGAVFGYTGEKLDLDESGSATNAKRFTGAVYVRYDLSPWFAEAVVGGSHANLDGKRTVAVPGYANTADIETKSRDFYGSARGGYTLQLGRAKITPYVGGQYVSWQADTATETGAKQASLKLQDQSRDSLASRAGLTVAFPFAGEEFSFTPRLDVAWRHEFRTARNTLVAEIAGNSFNLPGGSFASPGTGGILGLNAVADKNKRDGLVASMGFDVTFGSRFTAYLRVVAETDTATSQAIEVRAGSELRF